MTEQTNAPQKFALKKIASVTRELMKVKPGVEYYVRFAGEMHLGKEVAGKLEVDKATGEVKEQKREPAHIAFIDNLENGKEMQMICSTVLRKELDDAYPNQSYIGKCFWFQINKVEGKSYNLVEIAEVEDPDPARSAAVLTDWQATQAKKATSAPTIGDTAQVDAKDETDAPKAKGKK